MKTFDPWREFLFDYITVVSEVTLAIAVIGSIFAPDACLSFRMFFLPFAMAFLCMLPCIPIYLKEDMSIKQVLVQRLAELFVLEIAMCLAVRFVIGDSFPFGGYVAVLLSTAFLDVLAYLVKWYLEKEEVDKMNRRLEELRKRRESSR